MTSPESRPTARWRLRSDADLVAGIVFIAFGVGFGVAASRYDVGSLLRMGPGYFPLVVAVLLVGLGVLIAVKAFVAPDLAHLRDLEPEARADEPEGLAFEPVQWRPTVLLAGAAVVFAFTVDGLGLLPATFVTGTVASFARPGARPVRALVIAGALTAACYVIFVMLLQLRLSLVGEWLGG